MKCNSLEEVRENIDSIDDKIIKLIAERSDYVRQAAYFKKSKTDVKARKEGYATQDTTSKGEDVVKRKLVQSYSYSISVIDAKDTIQRLKNFNDNMMHIRIIGRAEPEFLYHQRL